MTRTLMIDDLLHASPLKVQGVLLDAHVSAVIRDVQGVLDLDSLDIRDVYMHVDHLPDMLLLDQNSLKTRHKYLYEAFEQALCIHALNQARLAPESSWTIEEYAP